MNEKAKSAWDYIENHQDDNNALIVEHLTKTFGITKDNAESAIVRWAVGDKDWFNENVC